LEPNESDFDAAAREVFEETGLRISVHFDLISNYWTVTNSYQSGSKNKRVVYWLGKIKPECDRKIQLSEEHVNFKWYSINEVLESLPSEHMTQALVKADEFLALNSENLNKIE
jgi:8-oxo-dGTP pyrophosphatase MutT (NUDIX family)